MKPEEGKWVYRFEEFGALRQALGGWDAVTALLGDRGARLADAWQAGLPVPPGFTLTTTAYHAYLEDGREFGDGLWEQVLNGLHWLEQQSGRVFGDAERPLLVSIRGGARLPTLGMRATLTNVGLNEEIVAGLAATSGDECFAWDSYCRLLVSFSDMQSLYCEDAYLEVVEGLCEDTALAAAHLKQLAAHLEQTYRQALQKEFPREPLEQLRQGLGLVFRSWSGPVAQVCRCTAGLPDDCGTAATVMVMVPGNLADRSGAGRVRSRDPWTGERKLWGEYLANAQGDDVIAGWRDPAPVSNLEQEMPATYARLAEVAGRLERHYRDVQEFEFVVERGQVWLLGSRAGLGAAPRAVVRAGIDMVGEGLITKEEAVGRVSPHDLSALLHPYFDLSDVGRARAAGRLLCTGKGASPGSSSGMLAFDADTAEAWGRAGRCVVLARAQVRPDDVHGIVRCQGIITVAGHHASNAVALMQQLGIPVVVQAAVELDNLARTLRAGDTCLSEGDWISLDGTTGEVYAGQIHRVIPNDESERDAHTLLDWADAIARTPGARQWAEGCAGFPTCGLQVRANAGSVDEVRRALRWGVGGVGLYSTDLTFFTPDRLPLLQEAVLNAEGARPVLGRIRRLESTLDTGLDEDGLPLGDSDRQELEAGLRRLRAEAATCAAVLAYRAALDELLPGLRSELIELFAVLEGRPVAIRLLDVPLHEFLPAPDDFLPDATDLQAGGTAGPRVEAQDRLSEAARALHEYNPLLGLRGARVGIRYPDLWRLQVRAIFEAACLALQQDVPVQVEILIPMVGHSRELYVLRGDLEGVARQVMAERGTSVPYRFGALVEVPRAVLLAHELVAAAEFLSFGIGDLTQMTYGYSRDDAECSFLPDYVETGILPENPFQVLDVTGVGELVRIGTYRGRLARPGLVVGAYGEQVADPGSLAFFHRAGLDYVSCSPLQVPAVRLAAAHAVLRQRGNELGGLGPAIPTSVAPGSS